ncbi:hypothetical protein E2542_SST20755 [Spatholobus suberectus]|nr:hypothetical protein E2542_SST20755 [Spatholobus suberectus]
MHFLYNSTPHLSSCLHTVSTFPFDCTKVTLAPSSQPLPSLSASGLILGVKRVFGLRSSGGFIFLWIRIQQHALIAFSLLEFVDKSNWNLSFVYCSIRQNLFHWLGKVQTSDSFSLGTSLFFHFEGLEK